MVKRTNGLAPNVMFQAIFLSTRLTENITIKFLCIPKSHLINRQTKKHREQKYEKESRQFIPFRIWMLSYTAKPLFVFCLFFDETAAAERKTTTH